MPECRPQTPDEIAILAELVELGDELLPAERRFVDEMVGRRRITYTEAKGIANLLARYAAKPRVRG